MAEVTIKINKTTVFVVGALILGAVLGGASVKLFASDSGYNLPKNTNVATNTNTNTGSNTLTPITLTKDDHIRGSKNAKIFLVEFSDFQCPYCQKFHPTMLQVMKDYKDTVAWVYRHFPLSFHQNAQISAEASECAGEQGKFWEFADMLFQKGSSDGTGLAKADLQSYAKTLGLDTKKFDSCLSSGKYTSEVNTDLAAGSAAGVTGTPGTILIDSDGNQQIIEGAVSYSQLKTAIDAALQ